MTTDDSLDAADQNELTYRLQDMVLHSRDVHAFLTSLVGVAAESFTWLIGECSAESRSSGLE